MVRMGSPVQVRKSAPVIAGFPRLVGTLRFSPYTICTRSFKKTAPSEFSEGAFFVFAQERFFLSKVWFVLRGGKRSTAGGVEASLRYVFRVEPVCWQHEGTVGGESCQREQMIPNCRIEHG